jgi:uncharacterized membrane protein HdeD (DUF308 family)
LEAFPNSWEQKFGTDAGLYLFMAEPGLLHRKGAEAMREQLLESWWVLALRGVIAVLFGVLALIWPGLTLLWLVTLFAAYALLGGTVSVFGAIKNRKSDEDWWLLLLLGLVGNGAGVIAVVHPGLTALLLVLVMGANALLTGVLDIAIATRLRKVLRGEWLLLLSGAGSIVFGIIVFLFPGAGALALVWLISAYALISGALLLAMAFRVRTRTGGKMPAPSGDQPDRRVVDRRRSLFAGHP